MTLYRFQEGRAGFVNDSSCNNMIRIYIFKNKEILEIDKTLGDTDDPDTIEKNEKRLSNILVKMTQNIINEFERLSINNNDKTFSVKRVVFYYNVEDCFLSILIGLKYSNTLTSINEIRFYISKALFEMNECSFFINNRDTHIAISTFDTSHCLEGPFKVFDFEETTSLILNQKTSKEKPSKTSVNKYKRIKNSEIIKKEEDS